MAVTLRLARHGQKKRPFYRIVAADKSCRRDGRFLEIVGTYNPMVDPADVTLKEDRVKHWIDRGATTSELVRSLIRKKIPGYLESIEEKRRSKIQLLRKKRKERAASR
ncbi:MAG: 30S ribosomal protein S16 [Candidatus Dadabacteria bacterium]|nr:MAG: 30S ribosomal protein S16 [Candidatus Dadabacteria bacterium]